MQAKPMQMSFYRVSAGAGILGGALAVVFNLLHPRSSDMIESARGELALIADSGIWRLDHIMLGLATALIFIGVIGIGLSMFGTAADTWARAWLIFSSVSVTLVLVTIALDGGPIKSLADSWAAGGKDAGLLAAATVLVKITSGLLGASVAMLFGLAPLMLGIAVLSGGGYPKMLGQVSIAAGALGLLDAFILAFSGFSKLSILVLFPIASVLTTIVLGWASWELWKKNALPRAGTAGTRTEPSVTPGL